MARKGNKNKSKSGEGKGKGKTSAATARNAPVETNEKNPFAREEHSVVAAAIEAGTKLTEVPEGFDFDRHSVTKKGTWATSALFHDYKAAEYAYRSGKETEKAEQARKMGTGAQRSQLARIARMRKSQDDLIAKLSAQGIDVEDALSGMDTGEDADDSSDD